MTSDPPQRIGIYGTGAWGTALALTIARAGRDVVLIARNTETAAALERDRQNTQRLPGIVFDARINVSGNAADCADVDALLIAVPAQALRETAGTLCKMVPAGLPVVLCAKGIERESAALMSEVMAECLPHARGAVLSGPSFAQDVARGLPTAVTLAAHDIELGDALVQAIGHSAFRPYLSDDVIGVEAGGAVKNVLAIAGGIVTGKRLGASASAALIARGFAELTRFGIALGGRAETLSGLSGLGDLILTATSSQSRNYQLGVALGEGRTISELAGPGQPLSEGMWTAPALLKRANRLRVEMPICQAVSAILSDRITVDDAVEGLLARPFRREI